jgi:hypothetical protein
MQQHHGTQPYLTAAAIKTGQSSVKIWAREACIAGSADTVLTACVIHIVGLSKLLNRGWELGTGLLIR